MKNNKKCSHCWHTVETTTDVHPEPKKTCGNFPTAGYDDMTAILCCKCGKEKEGD
jgi:hypothetical protein